MSQTANSECAKPSELKPCPNPECEGVGVKVRSTGDKRVYCSNSACHFYIDGLPSRLWNALPRGESELLAALEAISRRIGEGDIDEWSLQALRGIATRAISKHREEQP